MIKWDFLGNNDIFSKVFVTNIWSMGQNAGCNMPAF